MKTLPRFLNFRSAYVGLILGMGASLHGQDLIIPEPALQNAIARSLGVNERSLSKSLVEQKLTRMEANDLGIRDLTGLEHAKNLESLVLRDNLIDDLSPIHSLSNLKNLDLSGNRLTSLKTLAPLSARSLRIAVTDLASANSQIMTIRLSLLSLTNELSNFSGAGRLRPHQMV